MPIAVLHDIPGGTQEQYEQVAARLADGGSLDSLSDWPVDGILSHVAGPTENGWRVVDVWESEEAFQRFGEVLVPVLRELQMAGAPQILQVQNLVK